MFLIITGTSRGLGLGLKNCALSRGNNVFSIGRSDANYSLDLSEPFNVEKIFDTLQSSWGKTFPKQICLINNAGIIEPIAPMEKLNYTWALKNIHINLSAPMLLISEFLKRTDSFGIERKIINISSGAAQNPKGSWAPYSSAKAGLDALTKSLCEERSNDLTLQITTVNPGVMDTAMQTTIRECNPHIFPGVERFLSLKAQNRLPPPERIAEQIFVDVIEGPIKKSMQYYKAQ